MTIRINKPLLASILSSGLFTLLAVAGLIFWPKVSQAIPLCYSSYSECFQAGCPYCETGTVCVEPFPYQCYRDPPPPGPSPQLSSPANGSTVYGGMPTQRYCSNNGRPCNGASECGPGPACNIEIRGICEGGVQNGQPCDPTLPPAGCEARGGLCEPLNPPQFICNTGGMRYCTTNSECGSAPTCDLASTVNVTLTWQPLNCSGTTPCAYYWLQVWKQSGSGYVIPWNGPVAATSKTLTLPGGSTYYWLVYGVSQTGGFSNSSATWSFIPVIDSTAPSVPGTPNASPSPTNSVTTASWSASTDSQSGVADYIFEYSSNGGASWSTTTTPLTSVNLDLPQAVYQLRVKARDNVGNQSGYSGQSQVVVDKTAPLVQSLTVSTPTRFPPLLNFSYQDNQTAGSGVARVEVWRTRDLNGAPDPAGWQAITPAPSHLPAGTTQYTDNSLPAQGAGIYWYGLHIVDNAGNCIDESGLHCGGVQSDGADPRFPAGPARVIYDTIAPQIINVTPPGGRYACSYENPLEITATAQDGGAATLQTPPVSVHYSFVSGGEDPTCFSPEVPVSLTASDTVRLVACDALGNMSQLRDEFYNCDTSPPHLRYEPNFTSWVLYDINVQVTATDADGVSWIYYCQTNSDAGDCDPYSGQQVVCGKGTGQQCSVNVNLADNGQWYLCSVAEDTLGNTSSSQCAGPYQIDTLAPPTPQINTSASPTPTRLVSPPLVWYAAQDPEPGSGVQNYLVIAYRPDGQWCDSRYVTGTTYNLPAICTGASGGGLSYQSGGWLALLKQWWRSLFASAQAAGTPAVPGTYRLYVTAYDTAGNYSPTPATYSITIDTTPPVNNGINTSSSTPTPTNTTTPTTVWFPSADTQTGIGGYCVNFYQLNMPTPTGRVQCGGGCYNSGALSISLPASCYNPSSGGGNVTQEPETGSWLARWWHRLISTVFSAGGSGTFGGGDGTYRFEISSYDGVGNYSTTSMTRDVVIDRTPPPALIIEEPPTTPSPTNNTNPLVQWLPLDPAEEANPGCGSLQFFRGSPGSGTACTSPVCPANNYARLNDLGPCYQGNGSYYVELKSQDQAGNWGPTTIKSWQIDTVPPAVTLNSNWGYVNNGINYINSANQTSLAFSGACEAGGGEVILRLTSDAGGSTNPSSVSGLVTCSAGAWTVGGVNASTLPDGPLTVEVSQYDAAGNMGRASASGVKDTLAPGAAGGESVLLGLATNRDTTRNYCVRKRSDPPNACTLNNDGKIIFSDDLFTNSNFPTFMINCPTCSSGGSVSMDGKIKRGEDVIRNCSQVFESSGCTASFNSVNLRLRTRHPSTNDPQDNNAEWKIDISFLKDSAGNSPPPETWRTFEVRNLPPVIIPQ